MKGRKGRGTPLQDAITRDVDEELTFHIDMRVRDLMAEGWTAAAARERVLRDFGDVEVERRRIIGATIQDARRRFFIDWLGDVASDVRFAWRGLLRKPGFSIVAILTLCIGIGASTALFSIVNAVLMRPLPFASPDALVQVWPSQAHSPAEAAAIRLRAHSFSDVASYDGGHEFTLGTAAGAIQINASQTSDNLLSVLGVEPMLGRGFVPEEIRASDGRLVLLSERIWRNELDGAASVVGTTVSIQGIPYRVVGVMPNSFQFPSSSTDVWVPLHVSTADTRYWGVVSLAVIGRMKEGVTTTRAAHEVTQIAAQLRKRIPTGGPTTHTGKTSPLQS